MFKVNNRITRCFSDVFFINFEYISVLAFTSIFLLPMFPALHDFCLSKSSSSFCFLVILSSFCLFMYIFPIALFMISIFYFICNISIKLIQYLIICDSRCVFENLKYTFFVYEYLCFMKPFPLSMSNLSCKFHDMYKLWLIALLIPFQKQSY